MITIITMKPPCATGVRNGGAKPTIVGHQSLRRVKHYHQNHWHRCHNDHHHPHHYRHQSLVINIIAIIIVLNINRVLVIREMIKARVEGSTRQILNRLTYLAYPPSSICRHHHHIIATVKSTIITFNNIDMPGALSLHHHHCRIISPVSIRGDLCLGDQSTPPDVSCK